MGLDRFLRHKCGGLRISRPARRLPCILPACEGEVAAKEYGDYDMSPSKAGKSGGKDLYMIVDLTKTGKSAISYLDDVPKKG